MYVIPISLAYTLHTRSFSLSNCYHAAATGVGVKEERGNMEHPPRVDRACADQ